MRHSIRMKTISWALLVVSLHVQSTWVFAETGMQLLGGGEAGGFLRVEIPRELASLEAFYEAPPSEDARLILQIQDLHGSYEAQRKIQEILAYLYQKYAFSLIFVEGASEVAEPDYLHLFRDPKRNEELADSLARIGEMTGTELFMVSSERGNPQASVVGIEEPSLYRENYEAFKELHLARPEVDNFVEPFERRLDTLASRFLSPDTRRVLMEWKKFRQGRREFLPYVRSLAGDARRFLELDLESLFSQIEWPQITRLLVLQGMEKDLDARAAAKEKKRLMQFLRSKGLSEKLVEGVERMGEKGVSLSRMGSEEDRLENLPRYLLERLVEEAGPRGFHFYDYPAFSLQAGYWILQSELDFKALFLEIEKIFDKILAELAITEREKNLLELFRDSDLVAKLFSLELTREEWNRVAYRKEWLRPRAMVGRLHGIMGEPEPGSGEAAAGPDGLEKVSGLFDAGLRFYDLARKRESIFYERIDQEMGRRAVKKAVLVTGGFHTEGLTDLFREKGISYGVLLPRLAKEVDNRHYLISMLENQPTMFDITTLSQIFQLQKSEAREAQGADPRAAQRLIMDQVVRGLVSQPTTLPAIDGALAEVRTSQFAQSNGIEIESMGTPGQYRFVVAGDRYELQFGDLGGGRFAPRLTALSVAPSKGKVPSRAVSRREEKAPSTTSFSLGSATVTTGPLTSKLRDSLTRGISSRTAAPSPAGPRELALGPTDLTALKADLPASMQVALVAGRIAPMEGVQAATDGLARVLAPQVSPRLKIDYPLFREPLGPSYAAIVTQTLPSTTNLRNLAHFLAGVGSHNALTYVVAGSEARNPKIEAALKGQLELLVREYPQLGNRLDVRLLPPGAPAPILARAIQRSQNEMAHDLYPKAHQRGMGAWDLSKRFVVVVEGDVPGFDPDRISSGQPPVRSAVYSRTSHGVARDVLVLAFGALGDHVQLNRQLGESVFKPNGQWMEIVTDTFERVARGLAEAIQAARRLKTMA